MLIDSLSCIKYPYRGIFPSLWWDLFEKWYEDGWLVLVGYLMALTSDLILGHISPFCLSILEIEIVAGLVLDWALTFGLSMIYDIRVFPHGFIEIEIDCIRFYPWDWRILPWSACETNCYHHNCPTNWVIQMSSILCTLSFIFRWVVVYTLRDLSFEIRRQSSF